MDRPGDVQAAVSYETGWDMLTDRNYIIDQLNYIDADDYDTWMKVGAALKHEGLPCSLWDDWSRRSPKYKPGECERKWESFREQNAGDVVTGGTIWKFAEDGGWSPPQYDGLEMYEGMVIRSTPDQIIDPSFARESLPEFKAADYDPLADALKYLDEMFHPDDIVGFCAKSQMNEKGKYIPAPDGQSYGFLAKWLIRDLSTNGFERSVFAQANPDAGAWIRFNPLDGKGCGNSNVTRFDYALVESDDDDVEKQYAIYQQLNLPIKVLVHSGNKSLHAIVKVQAADASEYRDRVRLLYDTCSKNGLHVDEQDKNASRYSRFPGFMRNGTWQRSIAWDIGAASWDEWVAWLENEQDDLPAEVSLADAFADLPPLKPELIHGLLRLGHKMLISAPSKAGKSFALSELAVCIAEGMPWLGFAVEQGKVLYVNMELDSASCLHRFRDIYDRLGITEAHTANITVLNLRGYVTNLQTLSRTLVRRFKDKGYSCMIFDPLYKLNDGDENNAGDMTRLCNNFDAIARECGCSTVYSHHYSKGASAKYGNAMDRSSGSGVFARDPDCIIAMSEIEASEMHVKQYLEAYGHPPTKEVSGWELSFTVREFPTPPDARVWFDWPIHVPDDAGLLNDAKAESGGSGVGKDQMRRSERQNEIMATIASLLRDGDNAVRRDRLLEELEKNEGGNWNDRNLKAALDKSPYRSSSIGGGTKLVGPRDADEMVFCGVRYARPESDSGSAKWVPVE